MKRLLRGSSYVLMLVAGLLGLVSLSQGESGQQWTLAMLWTLAGSLFLNLPVVVANTLWPVFKRGGLPLRPRQFSQTRLRAPTIWDRFYRGFAFWMVLTVAVSTLSSEVSWLFAVLVMPIFALVLVCQISLPDPTAERRLLADQLAAGVEAEIALPDLLEQFKLEALSSIATRLGALPVVLEWLAFDLRCGSQFSMAVSVQRYFPPVWAALLMVGERSGQLAESLRMLARLEAQQPRRAYLLRPLLSLPVVVLLAGLTNMSTLSPEDLGLPPSAPSLPYDLLLAATLGAAILSLSAPWLRNWNRSRRLRDGLQSLPWIWPLARQEEQLLALTAMLAGARIGCGTPEILELGQAACTHSQFHSCLDAERAAAGDSLAQVLSSAFSPEVVALVAYGEAHGQLDESLAAALHYVEGRLAEERLRTEQRFLLVFQVLMGVLALLFALRCYLPLETYYLAILEDRI